MALVTLPHSSILAVDNVNHSVCVSGLGLNDSIRHDNVRCSICTGDIRELRRLHSIDSRSWYISRLQWPPARTDVHHTIAAYPAAFGSLLHDVVDHPDSPSTFRRLHDRRRACIGILDISLSAVSKAIDGRSAPGHGLHSRCCGRYVRGELSGSPDCSSHRIVDLLVSPCKELHGS